MRPSRQQRLRNAIVVGAIAICATATGCARLTPPELQPREDPFDVIYIASHDSFDPTTRQKRTLPRSAYKAQWFFLARRATPRAIPTPGKIHPDLAQAVATLPGSTVFRVVVSFTDTVPIRRFHRLNPFAGRADLNNGLALDSAQAMIDTITTHRTARYQADTLMLKTAHGAQIVRNFWLIQAVVADIPLDQVAPLAARPEVVYIQPDAGRQAPHHDDVRENDVDAARAAIGSDHYLLAPGASGGYMALLDTGVRTDHRLLCNPSSLCMVADCVSGLGTGIANDVCSAFGNAYSKCATVGGGDTYIEGHGTRTAAVLVGNRKDVPPNPNSGGWYRGVTSASLDCFQVYRADRKVSVGATLQAFEIALARLDHVIVAEMAEVSADMAPVALSADRAFVAGAVVVAANGNYESSGTGYPARGRRVMGVGAYHLQFNAAMQGLAYGVPEKNLVKPDILAPSCTETADNWSDIGMSYFTATSGATPYAAGAALLLRNWMSVGASGSDPGQVYAHLILSGNRVGPFATDSRDGAGRIRLPAGGSSRYGKVWVSDATQSVEIPIDIASSEGVTRLQAAIWWPEEAPAATQELTDTHNDVDLEIVSPGAFGTVKATSNGGPGVFERTAVDGAPTLSGKWTLRIRPYTMRTGPQVVYWAASLLK